MQPSIYSSSKYKFDSSWKLLKMSIIKGHSSLNWDKYSSTSFSEIIWSTYFILATDSFNRTLRATTRFSRLLYALCTFPKLPMPTTSWRSKSSIFGFTGAALCSCSLLEEPSVTKRAMLPAVFLFLFRVRTLYSYSSSMS